MKRERISGSFKDPSGFLFRGEDGNLYRQVNSRYQGDYDQLMESGLYGELIRDGWLLEHKEANLSLKESDGAFKIISPEIVPFISYPYEWCFSELQDAALLTLRIQKKAIAYGMCLKDASSYNVQFVRGRPIFIDTLSFERYEEGSPWVAYRQFCEHFLAPLLLMKYVYPGFLQILRVYMDGIPLELAAKVLPAHTRFNPRIFTHIFLHAKSKRSYAGKAVEKREGKFSRLAMLGFIDSLESTVKNVKWKPEETEWGDYYDDTNYSPSAQAAKQALVEKYLDLTVPTHVWDLGANDGRFSRLAEKRSIPTIAFDMDPACVEKNYLTVRENGEEYLLPLLLNLANPTPDLGWDNAERDSFFSRGPCDMALALALIHHLAISNNVPLPRIASFFERLCSRLMIEWVPKNDSQVRRLLAAREDIFDEYTKEGFEAAFAPCFRTIDSSPIPESERILYLMEKRDCPTGL
jgi:hypothetical protein